MLNLGAALRFRLPHFSTTASGVLLESTAEEHRSLPKCCVPTICLWPHCVLSSVPQNNEKQMRQLSVIPPMMYDSEQRRVKFINMNGLMDDPMKVYKSRQFMNVWTEHEKEIFKEK